MSGVSSMRGLLAAGGRIQPGTAVRALRGGVSCTVVTVEDPAGEWVAKAPLARLAVADPWPADRSRARGEAVALRLLGGGVGPLRTPRLRFFDAGRLVVGMEMVGPPAVPWKTALLAGRVDQAVGGRIGEGLSALHSLRPPPELGDTYGRRLYEQFRVDPYYRTTAIRVPSLAPLLEALVIDSTSGDLPTCLVHGDANPKNVLVGTAKPVLLDWELAHVGDPAFDLAMPVAHLLLKSLREGQPLRTAAALRGTARLLWDSYSGPARRSLAARHVGGIIAARLWGKSPVDYMRRPGERAAALALAETALVSGDIGEVWDSAAALSGVGAVET